MHTKVFSARELPDQNKLFTCLKQIFFLVLLLLFTGMLLTRPIPVRAQQVSLSKQQGVKPVGRFLSDSIKVGYPVKYALSLKHPADMEVIFPDSSYDYSPFEWVSKTYFPTRTDHTGSLDSVVYTLVSFELDSVQTIRLPVFIITKRDCTAVYAQSDSILFQSLLPLKTDSLGIKSNIRYLPVRTHFNYGYLALSTIGVLAAIFIVYLVFGKRIKQQYKLYTISREHTNFWTDYERLTRSTNSGNAVTNVENAVILWKKYMESLENKPFSTYTTKEIIEVIPNEQLAEALQYTDRIIYGQMASGESVRYTRILAYVAKRAYIAKRGYIEKQQV